MELSRPVIALGALLAFSALTPVRIQADVYDRSTTVTFRVPVAIPPVHLEGWGVLPPGTYVFKVARAESNRHIVQIFNKEQTQVLATVLAIPNYRLKPKDGTVMTFNEGIGGRPESVRAWFYPGAQWGEEFVYPKEAAAPLAKAAKTPVLQTAAAVPAEVAKPEAPAVISQLERAPVTAVQPSGETVELAQAVTPPPPEQMTPTQPPAQQGPAQLLAQVKQTPPAATAAPQTPAELPKTASNLPLLALCGLLALSAGLILRYLRSSLS